ncbi:MAG: DegT/DnrJ/EryC1/StrS aminotransferase family protein [Clostridia bacterium]|nr:DegT/DnrJ/EryC1/StrS aminotransferase family protein [Clostridia bacterium]
MLNIPFSPPDIGEDEIQAVSECLRSGWITTGPVTKKFEDNIAEYCGTKRAACLSSATACLELCLRMLGVGPGDEVITSAYTYTASASVIHHVGAKIVLVDTAKNSFYMDYDKLEQAITEHTKVIIPVDFAGVMCDYEKIFDIVNRKKNLFKPKSKIQKAFGRVVVISDSAHAFGSRKDDKISGSLADFTCFSFHAVKNLTTAEGGAVTWREMERYSSDLIYTTFMNLSLHGQTKDALAKTKAGSWEYDIVSPEYKYNMTDITASIGVVQLSKYDAKLQRRRELVKKYDEAFKELNIETLPHLSDGNLSNCHLYIVRLKGKSIKFRNNLIEKLSEYGVAANVHFKPLPMLTAYKNLGFDIKNYPNAYDMYKNEITLPLNTCITDEQADYVIDTFIKLMKEE